LISSFGNGMGPIALAFGLLHLHRAGNLNSGAREFRFCSWRTNARHALRNPIWRCACR